MCLMRSISWVAVLVFVAILMAAGGELLVDSNPNDLHVLWLAPKEPVRDGSRYLLSASSSVGYLALAIERVKVEGLISDKNINVTWIDCACSPKLSLGRLVDVIRVVIPDVIIGPPCTSAMIPVADLGSFFNVPVFSWISNEHTLDNKTRASTLVRTLPPLSSLGNLLLSVCETLDWHTISMISTSGGMTEGIADYFKEILDNNSEFFLIRHFDRVNASLTTESIRKMYALIKEEARIVFLIVPMDELRTYMLAAHDMGMTSGDFQFLFTRQMIAEDGFVKLLQGKGLWERGDGRDGDAYQAYRNLLYFTFSFMLEYYGNTVEAYNATVRVFGEHSNMPSFDTPDRYARFLYDAFYLYCLAANITRQRNQTVDGTNIFKAATEIGFFGMTGYVHLDSEADRLPSYLVWDMDLDGSFRIIMQISHNFYNNSITNITYPSGVLEIHWGNGMSYSEGYIPLDRPVCGFRNELCPEGTTPLLKDAADSGTVFLIYTVETEDTTAKTVIPAVLVSVMLVVVIVFFVLFRWWKKEQRLYSKTWRVLWKDLKFETQQMVTTHNGSHSTVNSDDHGGFGSMNSSFRLNPPPHQAYYCKTALLGNDRVAVRMIRKKNIRFDRKLLEELHLLSHTKHPNLTQFFGVCTDPPNLCILWEYCNKGSVQDVIHNSYNNYELDSLFQFSIALDICTGLSYIHGSEMKVHGNLTSANCLLDNRWTCKLSGFGVKTLMRGEKPPEGLTEHARYERMYWTAPEILRSILKDQKVVCTPASDIYSLAIVLKEILCKNSAFEIEQSTLGFTSKDIIHKVSAAEGGKIFRPAIGDIVSEYHSVLISFVRLIHECWQEDPSARPLIRRVVRQMRKLSPFKTTNIMDNMLKMMERYSSHLEDTVAERTAQLAEEKRRTDALLYRMLPQNVADELKQGQHVQAEAFSCVTIYFSDIVGFTQIASESTPMEIVEFLNKLYTVFDEVIQAFEVYKVETIGDAYMVVSGVPIPNGSRHVYIMADLALELLQTIIDFTIPHMPDRQLKIRIGLNTGPVVAGVVGTVMPRYCLFGDTVNLASRMESHGQPQKIHMSPFTYAAIEDKSAYVIKERGDLEIKGKGKMKTYFLEGKVEKTTNFAAGLMEETKVHSTSTLDVREVAFSNYLSDNATALKVPISPIRNKESSQSDLSRPRRQSVSPEIRSPSSDSTGTSPRRSLLTSSPRTRNVLWNGDTCVL